MPHRGGGPCSPWGLASDPHKGVVPTHLRVATSDPHKGVVPAHPGVLASDLPRFGFIDGALGCLTQVGGPRPMGKGQPHLSHGSLNPTSRQAGQRGWCTASSC